MGNIEEYRYIQRSELDEDNYFTSLLEEAVKCGIVSEAKRADIFAQCVRMLSMQTRQYNAGDSDSAPKETVQELLLGVFYTLGVALRQYRLPDDAARALVEKSLDDIFDSGYNRLVTGRKNMERLSRGVRRSFYGTSNKLYLMFLKDFDRFRKRCDIELFPHISRLELTWNLSRAAEGRGVERDEQQMLFFFCENEFLNLFSPERFDGLTNNDRYTFELGNRTVLNVLCAALGCALTGVEPLNLAMNGQSIASLYSLIRKKSREELIESASSCAEDICGGVKKCTVQYIKSLIPAAVDKLTDLADSNSLEKLFIMKRSDRNLRPVDGEIVVSTADRLSGEEYSEIVKLCTGAADSMMISSFIVTRMPCCIDRANAIKDICLSYFGAEYIFNHMTEKELAAVVYSFPELETPLPEYKYLTDCIREYLDKAPDGVADRVKAIAKKIVID